MNAIKNDIRAYLDGQTVPVSIYDVISALPDYNVRDIKEILWELAADGYIRFDYSWKITKANDGGYF